MTLRLVLLAAAVLVSLLVALMGLLLLKMGEPWGVFPLMLGTVALWVGFYLIVKSGPIA